MARGRTTHSRSAALALRAPAAGGSAPINDALAPASADWAARPGPAARPAPARRALIARAGAAAAACAIAGASWLGTPGSAQAAVGDAPAPDCEPGIALALETAPPAKVLNDGSGVENWSYTICARQTVQRIQTRIARLKDPRMDAREANLESVTPSETLTSLHGARSYQVPSGLAAGSYAVEVAYYTPDGRMADRAASVFRVAAASAPLPPPPAPTPDPTPIPDTPTPLASPPVETVPPAVPRADAPKRAKLRLTKRANRSAAKAGQRINWTLRVKNLGPAAARKLQVCDRLPDQLILLSAPGARLRGGEVCWSVKSLPKGRTRTFRLRTRVAPQNSIRMVTNRAWAKASNASRVSANANVIGIPTRAPNKPRVTG